MRERFAQVNAVSAHTISEQLSIVTNSFYYGFVDIRHTRNTSENLRSLIAKCADFKKSASTYYALKHSLHFRHNNRPVFSIKLALRCRGHSRSSSTNTTALPIQRPHPATISLVYRSLRRRHRNSHAASRTYGPTTPPKATRAYEWKRS